MYLNGLCSLVCIMDIAHSMLTSQIYTSCGSDAYTFKKTLLLPTLSIIQASLTIAYIIRHSLRRTTDK